MTILLSSSDDAIGLSFRCRLRGLVKLSNAGNECAKVFCWS